MTEDQAIPANPDNEYGWEKLYAERAAMAYARRYGMQVRIARFQNCYGPEGTWTGGREKAPAAMCRKVAEAPDGGTVEVWGDGSAIRSYTYVSDMVDGIYRLMQSDLTGATNLGCPQYVTVDELVATVAEVAGKEIHIKHVPGPVGVQSRNFSNERAYSIGWRPRVYLKEGISLTYPWVEAQVRSARSEGMNADTFAEWFRRQGYRVVRTASSYWYEAGARVWQAFPYHWLIEPSAKELRELLLRQGGIALRYSTPLSASQGKVSYHIVCENPQYDLASLTRQARQNTRRGLEYAEVRQIPLARLAQEGWALRRDTLERQGRLGAESETWWRRMCATAEDLPGFEAWGALHNDELTASFLAFTCDDRFTLPHEQSATAHLEYRPNNAIFYEIIRQAVQRPGINGVFFGLHSLDAPATVDEFKLRMGCDSQARAPTRGL